MLAVLVHKSSSYVEGEGFPPYLNTRVITDETSRNLYECVYFLDLGLNRSFRSFNIIKKLRNISLVESKVDPSLSFRNKLTIIHTAHIYLSRDKSEHRASMEM